MTVLERPAEVERTGPVLAPEAIFPEARRRGRRRRAISALAASVALGLATVMVVVLEGAKAIQRDSSPLTSAGRSGSAHTAAALVAWADYAGALHLGDVATHRQLRINVLPVAESSAGPVVYDRGRLLWGDARNRIRSVQIATGKARVVSRGTAVLVSPNGARLYVDQGTRDFLEIDARTLRASRRLPLPKDWNRDPWVARPVAGGLVLTHAGPAGILGIWHPGSGVRPLGAAIELLDVYTPAQRDYSLVAWLPRCSHRGFFGNGCPLAITNTATFRTVTVPSPNRYGFTGGAFSPAGTELATFVNTDDPTGPSTPRSVLAIVNTATGALRLDRRARLITTEDAAWATWLPSGRQLLTGAITATYLVDTHSLATRPYYFDGPATRLDSIMSSSDLNFSTIVVPQRALSIKQRRSLAVQAPTMPR